MYISRRIHSAIICFRDILTFNICIVIGNLFGLLPRHCKGNVILGKEENCAHDLAARNCLVDSKMQVKISDFGMTRVLMGDKNYYKVCKTTLDQLNCHCYNRLYTDV